MKIWHISDTHTYHELLSIPEDIDMVIHSGDCSNPRDPYTNEREVRNFIDWYSNLKIKHKIYVAGNHDTRKEKRLVKQVDFHQNCIHYLENESIEIEGIKIWGSPITPTFGDWAFMRARHKTHNLWQSIPNDTDIIIVHGPPMGIMDLSYDRDNILEFCGDAALRKRVLSIQPKLFLSGHIHNCKDIINAGTLKLSAYKTIFSNGSVVTDNKFGVLSSNGNQFEV